MNSQTALKKITEKKAYQPEEVFNSDENALLLKKKKNAAKDIY